MRSTRLFLVAALVLGMGTAAYAELQNVSVSGSLRIRGNWFEGDGNDEVKFLTLGDYASDSDAAYVEQRVRLGVRADFTEDVSAFIELDSYFLWGEDFRSQDYITGSDGRASMQGDDAEVEVYQAYVEARDMWGSPLHLRVGRQEISLGSEWLVGVNDVSAGFWGLSFDAAMLSLVTDPFTMHAFGAKLVEGGGDPLENDLDLYGVYASVTAVDDMVFDAYGFYLVDGGQTATASPFILSRGGRVLDAIHRGIFGATVAEDADIFTVGLRTAGDVAGFDWAAEVAYQFGNIDLTRGGDLDYDSLGANVELGYTIDVVTQPRPFLGFAYFGGGDSDTMPFNRLFSNWEYSEFLENTAMSNVWIGRGGFGLSPIEEIDLSAVGTCFVADKGVGDHEMTAWELGIYAAYNYSEDLVFRVGYAHLWAMDGAGEKKLCWPGSDGDRIVANGTQPFGSWWDDHMDYAYVETEISF